MPMLVLSFPDNFLLESEVSLGMSLILDSDRLLCAIIKQEVKNEQFSADCHKTAYMHVRV